MSSTFFNNLVAATYLEVRSIGANLGFGFLFDGLDAVAAFVAEKIASIWNSIFSSNENSSSFSNNQESFENSPIIVGLEEKNTRLI